MRLQLFSKINKIGADAKTWLYNEIQDIKKLTKMLRNCAVDSTESDEILTTLCHHLARLQKFIDEPNTEMTHRFEGHNLTKLQLSALKATACKTVNEHWDFIYSRDVTHNMNSASEKR